MNTTKTCFLVLATCRMVSGARGFLDQVDEKTSVWMALNDSLRCGSEVHVEEFDAIEEVLRPMWQSMPVDAEGFIEIRSLRYLAHRYFSQASSLRLRGFEPSDIVQHSSWDVVELSQRVPNFVESGLGPGKFTLRDGVVYIAALQQIIFNADSAILERVIRDQGRTTQVTLSSQDLTSILDKYVLHWMGGDAFDGICFHPPGEQSNVCFEVPMKRELMALVRAQVKALDFKRNHGLMNSGRDLLQRTFSFSDAHAIANSITKNFAWFYESDCTQMQETLIKLDTQRTGRISLAKFYAASPFFAESEDYLRAQGVLDSSASSREPQVIIPNYLQAASNCIVATAQYHICCPNHCERLLGELEVAVRAASATVDDILAAVDEMEEEHVKIGGTLRQRLTEVSERHGGEVRLHSRLFAQWLHYVFPQECPFPHKAGTVSKVSAMEYTGVVEVPRHVREEMATNSTSQVSEHEESSDWMSQWNEEEELLAGYSSETRSLSSFRNFFIVLGGALLLLAGRGIRKKPDASGVSFTPKSHWV